MCPESLRYWGKSCKCSFEQTAGIPKPRHLSRQYPQGDRCVMAVDGSLHSHWWLNWDHLLRDAEVLRHLYRCDQ